MAIKVVVGSSPQRSVTTVLDAQQKPLITPDSVTLGIDTIGEYVATLTPGNGIVLFPEDANTRNVETANITIVHANTSSEVNTNNDILSFIRNVDIDQFGHVTVFYNNSLDSNTFFFQDGVITTHDITIGNTSLTLNETVDRLEELNFLNVQNLDISNNTIASNSSITLAPIANSFISVSNSRISDIYEPLLPQDAATKNYIDSALDQLEEGLLFVADPQGPNDATNKRYVDNLVQGLNVKPSAKAATTGDLGGTFFTGNSTFSSTITLSQRSVLNIDGVRTWELGDNILVKDQNFPHQNGTYDIIQVGNVGEVWILQRSPYANESSEMPGAFEFVVDGDTNGNKAFVATVVDAETYVLDQDDVNWTQFFGEGNFTAGKDLTLVGGREFNLNSNVNLETITSLDLETLRIVSNTVVLDSTGGIVIPVGTTDERPTNIQGMIRYNTTDNQFEGYNGGVWSGLGGVIDADQDTFVRAESAPGTDEDQLQFFTAGQLRQTIDSDGSVVVQNRLIIPVGTTGERYPSGRQGSIRFNIDDRSFEGFDGLNWTGLGGVKDADQDTFIRAETSSGADDDQLQFFTAGEQRAEIRNNGDLGFGSGLGKLVVNYDTGNTAIAGKLTINTKTILGDGEVTTFNTNGAIKLPAGTTVQRPDAQSGMIRFNIDDNRFEGYDGTIWAGLAGSVIDVDQDTKITAESSPNADNDQLRFTTSGDLRFTIEANGVITTPSGEDLTFKPSGFFNVSNTIITGVADPVNPSDAVSLNYLENGGFASTLGIIDGANTNAIDILKDPTLTVGRGLEVQNANSSAFELAIDQTGVQPGIYGNDGQVPRVRILEDGRVDFATEVPIEIVANAVPDFTETTMDIIGLMFRDGNQNGVVVEYRDEDDVFDVFHANTSNIANTNNSGGEFIQNLQFDEFGHALVLESANLDVQYLKLDGTIPASNTIIAPRFADSANTEYYVDPLGTSQLRNIILGFGFNNSQIEMIDGPTSADRSVLYAAGGEIGFLDNTFNYFAKANRNTGDFTVTGNLIAGGFADSQDTSYVINPADLSNIKNLDVEENIFFNANSLILNSGGFSSVANTISFNGSLLQDVLDPVANTDAVNLNYLLNVYTGTTAGEGISGNNGVLTINVDDSTIEINNDILRVKDEGITNAKIATPFFRVSTETNPQVPDSLETGNFTLTANTADTENWFVDGSLRANTFNSDTDPTIYAWIGDTLNFTNDGPSTSPLYIKLSPTGGTGDQAFGVQNQGAHSGNTVIFLPDTEGTFYYVDGNNQSRAGQIVIQTPYVPQEEIYLGETLTFTAGEGINTRRSNNEIIIEAELATTFASNDNRGIAAFEGDDFDVANGVVSLANSGVTANTYGSSTAIPVLTVDEHGLITLASTASVAGVDGFSYESSNNTITLITGDGSEFHIQTETSVELSGKVTGVATSSNGTVQIATELEDTGVVANTYGSTTAIPVITVDEDGRITEANTAEIVTTLTITLEDDVTGTVTASDGNLTIQTDIANTGVVANTYGSSTEIPVITIDEDGRISLANTAAVAGVDDFSYEPSNNTITLVTGDGSEFHLQTQTTVDLSGKVTGVATSSNGTVEVVTELANTGVTADTYGSPTAIPVITVDEDGRITLANTAAVAGVDSFSYEPANNTITLETGDGSVFHLQTQTTVTLNGDVTGTATSSNGTVEFTTDIANSGVVAGVYGSASQIPIVTVAEDGRITSMSNTAVAGVEDFIYTNANNTLLIQTGDGSEFLTNISIFSANVTFGDQVTFLEPIETVDINTTGSITVNDTQLLVTNTEILEGIKTVDGQGSLLDADLLDGQHASDILSAASDDAAAQIGNGRVDISTGDGLSGSGAFNLNDFTNTSITFTHGNTSDVANVDNSDGNVIQDLNFDEFGHVISTGSTDFDLRYLQLTGGTITGNLIVDGTINRDPRITLTGFVNGFTDLTNLSNGSMVTSTDTELLAGDGLIGGGSINANVTISHADTSDQANLAFANTALLGEFIADFEVDQFGHVVNVTKEIREYIDVPAGDARYVNETGDTMTGNLEVQAVISQDFSAFRSESLTTTTTSPTVLFVFAKADFMGGEVTITGKRGINKHITKMLIVHDGTTASATEYGQVVTDSELGSYDVLISGSDVQVLVTPSTSTSTEFLTFATLIKD